MEADRWCWGVRGLLLGPSWAPQRCDTQAVVPAYRVDLIGAGLRGNIVQQPLALPVMTQTTLTPKHTPAKVWAHTLLKLQPL